MCFHSIICLILPLVHLHTEIIDSMNDDELDHPENVNGKAKERIAAASGKSIDQVRSLIFLHKQTSIVHRWIHLK